jgi:metal-dependent hydrolase (beta-lactamase superfamily II)
MHERVYEQTIEGHLSGGEMETAGWDALLNKNENLKFSVKDIDFVVVSHHGRLSGLSEALYAVMGKKAILEHSFRYTQ